MQFLLHFGFRKREKMLVMIQENLNQVKLTQILKQNLPDQIQKIWMKTNLRCCLKQGQD